MVELRKRPAPKETATPAPAAKRSVSKPRAAPKAAAAATATAKAKAQAPAKAATEPEIETESNPAKESNTDTNTNTDTNNNDKSSTPLTASSIGTRIPIAELDSTIRLNSDTPTSLNKLLSSASRGLVIFSYPKASTPGCTTQACLFRDSYQPLTQAGLAVYGLSADSPKANSTFVSKQRLPFELLCDVDGVLSGPLGLKKSNPAKGTVRGVVVLGKIDGDESNVKVDVFLLGGPQKTLDVVLEWVEKEGKPNL